MNTIVRKFVRVHSGLAFAAAILVSRRRLFGQAFAEEPLTNLGENRLSDSEKELSDGQVCDWRTG
jgi:hypothetical protein